MSWAGISWNTGILLGGKRYQRTRALVEADLDFDEDLYADLW